MAETIHDQTITDFKFRPIQEEELEEIVRLTELEGWNLTLNKCKQISELFGSVYVTINNKGKVTGTVSVVPSHDGEYVLGNLVVASNHRGKGLGRRMLTEILRIYAGKIITLVSVQDALDFYSKFGFHSLGPVHEVIFMEVDTTDVENKLCDSEEIIIKAYTPDLFKELVQYDNILRGYDMSKYLSVMVKTSHMYVACSKSSGDVTGYASGIQKGSRLVVDGCFADTDDIALHLFWNILKAFPEKNLVKLQTIKPRMFLTTAGKILSSQCHNYRQIANGILAPASLQNLYAVTDSDYSI